MKPNHIVDRPSSERARSEYRPRRERLGIQAQKRRYDEMFFDLDDQA